MYLFHFGQDMPVVSMIERMLWFLIVLYDIADLTIGQNH